MGGAAPAGQTPMIPPGHHGGGSWMQIVRTGLMSTPPAKMSPHFGIHQSGGMSGGSSPAGGGVRAGSDVGRSTGGGVSPGAGVGVGVAPGASDASGYEPGGSAGGFDGAVPPGKAHAV